jgi:hypothetical protein
VECGEPLIIFTATNDRLPARTEIAKQPNANPTPMITFGMGWLFSQRNRPAILPSDDAAKYRDPRLMKSISLNVPSPFTAKPTAPKGISRRKAVRTPSVAHRILFFLPILPQV